MRINLCACAFLAFLIIFAAYFSATSIQDLVTSQEQGKPPELDTNPVSETGTTDLLNEIMGFEEACESKDEECLNRRMTAEAHIDYIYTQHHKP